MRRLLLLSNSTMPGEPFFQWPAPVLSDFLGKAVSEVVFIPFAGVTISYDQYADRVDAVFSSLGYKVTGLHRYRDPVTALRRAAAIVAGGGNTWALLARLHGAALMDVVRERVAEGVPYIGWSAGSNLACPTIMTTNDMPVMEIPSLKALDLVPFQINPHYHELRFEGQGGETRVERLAEFLAVNPEKRVLGLPEGTYVRREGDTLQLGGRGEARLYTAGEAAAVIRAPADVSFLLQPLR